eukprot:gnl/TRDRNA2_/TRDRNA2_45182_c0_seq1.p1 gnl/TRDRNA2_/TRDRNA2_45182_c0~~gnl/TRDRNA2_/TRDRNA2_45182_c0_seq1.p1  ORF type:complete len:248 (-),score=50.63 gnl/TRDRNA2_/TRDRNA2_45182_c0_seq1:54-797(-)
MKMFSSMLKRGSKKEGGKQERQAPSTHVDITIYRPAHNGIDEDTLPVHIERAATFGDLKRRLEELYEFPCALQVLKRDVDGPALVDTEPLACAEGDVLYLWIAGPSPVMDMSAQGTILGVDRLLQDMVASATQAATQMAELGQAMQESLNNVTYTLNFVSRKGAGGRRKEQRCSLDLAATARVNEILEILALELNAEGEPLSLEFGGQLLPAGLPLHALGVNTGDTLMVVRRDDDVADDDNDRVIHL